ncbi:hypothetical protein [Synechococcus sp. CBW1004]|uniref:hypothetical protein n=1 Tax=Synechococcus sp. CBW1004 TaxID=1353136 RepID=UPI0018CC865F|nr:hypothetical protein [Synechococcus sp. CBW1004]QPN61989.1 hypothetical protein H8F25_09270 [Synechococcus sp. CBW1004]
MPDPFHPVTITTSSTRRRDGEEPTTTILRETTYSIEATDQLVLNLAGVLLERGGYGDPYRETLRIESFTDDVVADAVIALLHHSRQQLLDVSNGELYRARCRRFLRRAAEALPDELRHELGSLTTPVEG